MSNTRDIIRRIKSIKNTKKITKAMEMVSSSKMRRAVNSVLASRSYSNQAWELILNVSGKTKAELHPLLSERKEVKKIGLLLISSNRGLCGSFNQQVTKLALDYIKKEREKNPAVEIEIIAMGKKGAKASLRLGQSVVAEFEKSDVLQNISEIRPVAQMLIKDYLKNKYDQVAIFYTDYISMLKQAPKVKQILPIRPLKESEEEIVGVSAADKKEAISEEYLFEPSPRVILSDLLPRLLEVQIYQALLESNASEQSARMLAMRNASDAASDMIDELTLTYNQARQAAITKEIAEIAGGKAALE